jgi:hypothetical protein
MAKGDGADLIGRIRRLLPPWFADASPLLVALLTAPATAFSFIYQLIAYAQLQTRVRTATGGWLDLIAQDFFGETARRQAGQSDTSFRNTIIVNLFRERATRRAVTQVITGLTGSTPAIFEPSRIQDTGAYATPAMGYGVAGAYGSLLLPFQAFVVAKRPVGSGIPSVAGWGISAGGYGRPSQAEWASLASIAENITDNDIYAALDGVKPVGIILWARVLNGNPVPDVVPNFSLLVGQNVVRFGTDHQPIRLLGWRL